MKFKVIGRPVPRYLVERVGRSTVAAFVAAARGHGERWASSISYIDSYVQTRLDARRLGAAARGRHRRS